MRKNKNILRLIFVTMSFVFIVSCSRAENTVSQTQAIDEMSSFEEQKEDIDIEEQEEKTCENEIPSTTNSYIEDYTWEEFEELSSENQMKFQNGFEDFEAFEKWMQEAQGSQNNILEENEKALKVYSWEEFEELTPKEQMEFQNSFEGVEAFEKWMQEEQERQSTILAEGNTTLLKEYTWEEFNDLSSIDQMRFQNSFEDIDEFEKWIQKAREDDKNVLTEVIKKQIKNYTWEEFEKLTPEEQMVFQNSFDDFKKFDDWMMEAQGLDNDFTFENEGKQLASYTWEEFENLSPEDQIKFQNSFKNVVEFDKWLQGAQRIDESFTWDDDKKNPSSYTWEEFEDLSPEDQMKFQNSFKDINEFDKWLQKAQANN